MEVVQVLLIRQKLQAEDKDAYNKAQDDKGGAAEDAIMRSIET